MEPAQLGPPHPPASSLEWEGGGWRLVVEMERGREGAAEVIGLDDGERGGACILFERY